MAIRTVVLGITAPVPKGEWNAAIKYQVLNIVTKGSASYIAISTNMGIEPETHSSWTSYWQLLSKGLRGETGAKIVSQEYIGKDENGGNIYKQTFDDGKTFYFTAPRGEKGEDGDSITELPSVSTGDNGKVLQVVNGKWEKSTLNIDPSNPSTPVIGTEEWEFTDKNDCVITKRVYAETLNVKVSGSWYFNKTITPFAASTYSVNFYSYDHYYTALRWTLDADGNSTKNFSYIREDGNLVTFYNNGAWLEDTDEDRLIKFAGTQVVTVEFYSWLTANARKSGGLIAFTISEVTYKALEGMTWAEWVNSEYNTDGWYVDEYDGKVYNANNEYLTTSSTTVYRDDKIIANETYYRNTLIP